MLGEINFTVKNLPIADIFAEVGFLRYDKDTTDKEQFQEGNKMRHMYIRGILAVIWLAAAVVSGVVGRFEMALLYVVLGGVFFYSAYRVWKKEKDEEGDR